MVFERLVPIVCAVRAFAPDPLLLTYGLDLDSVPDIARGREGGLVDDGGGVVEPVRDIELVRLDGQQEARALDTVAAGGHDDVLVPRRLLGEAEGEGYLGVGLFLGMVGVDEGAAQAGGEIAAGGPAILKGSPASRTTFSGHPSACRGFPRRILSRFCE